MSDDDGYVDAAREAVSDQVPGWVSDIDDIDSYIQQRITLYILGLIAGFVATVEGAIDGAFSVVVDAMDAAGGSFESAYSAAAAPFIGAIELFEGIIVGAAASLGPLGPVFIAAVTIAIVVVTIRALIAIADSVPIVQGVVTFFQR